jgi:hypothetical protein
MMLPVDDLKGASRAIARAGWKTPDSVPAVQLAGEIEALVVAAVDGLTVVFLALNRRGELTEKPADNDYSNRSSSSGGGDSDEARIGDAAEASARCTGIKYGAASSGRGC